MGVDYEAVAGYGFKVKDKLNEKGKKLLDKCSGSISTLLEEEMEDIEYWYLGCSYSGTDDIYILCSDPLGTIDGKTNLEIFRQKLDKYKEYFTDTDLEWECEVYVY